MLIDSILGDGIIKSRIGCIPTKVRTNSKGLTRTEISSFELSLKNIMISFLGLIFCIVAQTQYKGAFLAFTLSSDGIMHQQEITSESMKKFWFILTEMGGAKETGAAVAISFFGLRPRFFYYLCILSMIVMMISYMKIAYHEPRPYMIEPGITPLSCSRAFGQPSGHSMSAALIAITMVLDIFHGT